MHKKLISFSVVLVALCGFALAVFIPAASADKAHNTYTEYTEYCEDGSTVYSEYSEYCESSTTTTTSSTPVISSPGSTPITGGGSGSSVGSGGGSTSTPAGIVLPAGVTIDNITAAEIAAILASLGISDIGGHVNIPSVGPDIPVGTPLARGCYVSANNGVSSITVTCDGNKFTVPYGAELAVDPDGTCVVTTQSGQFTANRVAHRALPATVAQTVILPKGKTAQRFAYVLPSSVSFGKGCSWAHIAKAFAVQIIGRSSKRASVTKQIEPFVVAAANKARNAWTIKTAKAGGEFTIAFSLSYLKYTSAEIAKIKSGSVKSISPAFAVKRGSKKPFYVDRFAFSYKV